MIVRRYDRATGKECKPVSVKQAAWAIARAFHPNPLPSDVEAVEMDLRSGTQNGTAGYLYVPDADPPSDG